MSHAELIVTADKRDFSVVVEPSRSIELETTTIPDILVIAAGNVGPPGPSGKWEALTQNEYDMLNPPNPDILYIIIQ